LGKFILGLVGALIIGIGAYMSKPAGVNQFDAPKAVVAEKLEAMPSHLFKPFEKFLNIRLGEPAVSKTADGDLLWTFGSGKGMMGSDKGKIEILAKLYEGFSGRTTVEFTINVKNDPEMTAMPMTQTLAHMAGSHAALAQMTTGEIDAYRMDQDFTEYASINGQAMMYYKTRGMFSEVSSSLDEAAADFDDNASGVVESMEARVGSSPRSKSAPTTDLSPGL
jgi:hypothetical protein